MRIANCFAKAKAENRAALGIFISAGDPDRETSQRILNGLPGHGADFVELGMPFSDPMADGPAIQASSERALRADMNLKGVLEMAKGFRKLHPETPLILMGYYNPIYIHGTGEFLKSAVDAGVDGMIMVDLPPEEDGEFCLPAVEAGIEMIRLVTPTTDAGRMPKVLARAGGFVYYVSITGITGTRSASADSIAEAMAGIRAASDLPAVVGFGIRSPEQVKEAARHADGVVVGSAVVEAIANSLDTKAKASDNTATEVFDLVAALAKACPRR